MHSEEVKQLIKDQVLLHQEIRAEIAAASGQEKRHPQFLNQPFVVTLLGGLLIAGLTTYLQRSAALDEQRTALRERQYERRYSLFNSFVDKVQTHAALFSDYVDKWLYLREFANVPELEREMFRGIHEYDEVSKAFYEEGIAFFQRAPIESQFGLVRATYTSSATHESLSSLEEAWSKMRQAYESEVEDRTVFSESQASFQEAFQQTINAMSSQLDAELASTDAKVQSGGNRTLWLFIILVAIVVGAAAGFMGNVYYRKWRLAN